MYKLIRTCSLLAALAATFHSPAFAEVRDLNPTEKGKVHDALDLVEEAYKKAGKLGTSMSSELNMAGDPGGALGQIPYEDANATFQDAINKMRDMLDSDRIRVDTKRQLGARTRNKSGTDADVVLLAGGVLKKMCAAGDDGGRFFSKIRLGASLANEMVHVWQIFAGNDARQCDAERDSDTATLIFMCELKDAFAGTTGPGDIDGAMCPKLKACLTAYGVQAGAEWGVLTDNVPRYKDYYSNRRTTKFDNLINSGLSWGKGYYGDSNYTRPITFAELTTPSQSKMTSTDGMSEAFYTLPLGKKILRRDVSRNDLGQIVLTVVAQDVNTLVLCTYVYTDTNGDGLPETTPVVSQSNTPANNETDDQDTFLLPFLPGDDENGQTGWTILDAQDGTVYEMPIDPLTMQPVAPFFDIVFQDPGLSNVGGGFFYHHSVLDPLPDQETWIFMFTPPVMAHPDQPVILFDIDLLTGNWNFAGNSVLEQALFPTNTAGVLQFDVGMTQLELVGFPNPGIIEVFDIGSGPSFPILPPVPLDPLGISGPLPIPPLPPGLFLFETQALTLMHQTILFQPANGENVDCAGGDETGDGTPDRLQLTLDPPRLHFMEGVPGDSKGAVQHLYEMVLEDDGARHFQQWGAGGREIVDIDGPNQDFLLLPGSAPPLYAQSLRDLDGDSQADDTVIVRGTNTLSPAPNYFIETILNALTLPQVQITPLNFNPVNPVFQDLDGDSLVDLVLSDFDGGPDRCFLNNGAGQLVPGDCFESFCFGDGGDQMGCTDCPCGNNAPGGATGGCQNTFGTSCTLQPSGTSSILAADLRFEASGVAPLTTALLVSANEALPFMPSAPCFGLNSGIQTAAFDGLRCVGQGLLRHGVRPSDAQGDIGVTTNGWGTPNGFGNFAAFVSGGVKYFQIFYRDDAMAGCGTGLNTSQGVRVEFKP